VGAARSGRPRLHGAASLVRRHREAAAGALRVFFIFLLRLHRGHW
jgi:hypothetical protein